MNATVYSKPACVQCNQTYKAFDRKGLEFGKIDITQDPEAYDKVIALGYMQAPVVIVEKDGEIVDHWSGFNDEKIAELAEAVAA